MFDMANLGSEFGDTNMADVAPDLAANLLAAFSSAGEEKVEPAPAAPAPEAVGPASPPKRPRPAELESEECAEKRQKTEHEVPKNAEPEAAAGSWNISAMIQNALGSLDDQFHEPNPPVRDDSNADAASGQSATATPQPQPPAARALSRPRSQSTPARRIEQKRMKLSSNPYYVMRTMSLPLLGSLAVQILLALSQQSTEETQQLLNKESEYRKAYDILRKTFEHAKQIFSESSPLLFADELEVSDSEDRETLRVSNLATISSSICQGDDGLLSDCDRNFAAAFVPEDGDLPENSANLHVSLKTQAFLRSLRQLEDKQARFEVLDRFFPPSEDVPVDQPRDGLPFSAEERERLASGVKARRQALLEFITDDDKEKNDKGSTDEKVSSASADTAASGMVARLADKYPFDGLIADLSTYLQTQLGTVIEYAEKYGINIPFSEELAACDLLGNDVQDAEPVEHDELSLLLQNATSNLAPSSATEGAEGEKREEPPTDSQEHPITSLSDSLGLGKLIQDSLLSQDRPTKEETAGHPTADGADSFESRGLASLIASKLSNGFGNAPNGTTHGVPTTQAYHHPGTSNNAGIQAASPLAQLNQLNQTPYYSYTQTPAPAPQQTHAEKGALPPNQTHPTAILYERARQAAVAKSSSTARREGLHSTRRAWTPEEEKALMAGLDMVKGPHWSQILTLFGQNGAVSDILKDRTQVQLKDKARNLKLFFLKTNSEMPYYLQCVTGELKTRAPSQAARKEAEEKARMNSEEEHTKPQGLATLSTGVHNNLRQAGSPVPISAASAPARASPAASATGASASAFPASTTAPAPKLASLIKSEPADPSTSTTITAAAAAHAPRVERPATQPATLRPDTERPDQANQPSVSALQKPEPQAAASLPRTQEPKIESRPAQPTGTSSPLQTATPATSSQHSWSRTQPSTSLSASGTSSAPPEASAPAAKAILPDKPAQPRDISDLPHLEALRALQASMAASSS